MFHEESDCGLTLSQFSIMSSIKAEATRGVMWISLANYSGVMISIIISAILARNISPAAFGTIAVATVIMVFLDTLSDFGIGPAIIQFKTLNKSHISSLFSFTLLLGLFLGLTLFGLATPLARYYSDSDLTEVCHWLSLSVLFKAANIVPNSLVMKAKKFKYVAIRNVTIQLCFGILAALAAINGAGIYALLIAPVLSAPAQMIINMRLFPIVPKLKIDWEVFRTIGDFSLFQFLFGLINYFARNIDTLLIGKYLSMTQLGYYDKAYRLMLLPLNNITRVITPVLHPLLSSFQNDLVSLADKNNRLTYFMASISFPIGLICFFCGGEAITLLYGNNWEEAIPVFQILALSIPLQMIQSTSGTIYQSAGNTRLLFLGGVINTVCALTTFLIAVLSFKTIESVAWAWVITLCINFISTYFILNRYVLNYPLVKFIRGFIPQIINSTIVCCILIFSNPFLPKGIIQAFIVKILIILSGTIVMGKILKQYDIKEIVRSISNKIPIFSKLTKL